MSFKELNLHAKLLQAVEACGFTQPTDIQREAIPVVLAGKDLMASAQTGTGKTAAFVLPALQKLLNPAQVQGKGPRVLVLTPTRELAMQVTDNIQQFSRFAKFTTGSVVGGMPYPPQMRLLSQPLDLLVATPGRLMDHMERGRVDFSRLEILILDEADRMLDMGFIDDVKLIAKSTPANRQTLLFSATLEGKVMAVAKALLKEPARIQLAANHETHASISQHIHSVDNYKHKQHLLQHYLNGDAIEQAVIFTATKRGADELARQLSELGHPAAALHGDMGQNQRKRTIERMRRRKFKLLVATDVAARGLDIRGISHVINYDLPMIAEDYIHRIGRTGRGGASGMAISLVSRDDWSKLRGIERLTGQQLKREVIPGLEPTAREPGAGFAKKPGRNKPNGFSHGRPRRGSAQAKPSAGGKAAAGQPAKIRVRKRGEKPAGKGQKSHYRSQPVNF